MQIWKTIKTPLAKGRCLSLNRGQFPMQRKARDILKVRCVFIPHDLTPVFQQGILKCWPVGSPRRFKIFSYRHFNRKFSFQSFVWLSWLGFSLPWRNTMTKAARGGTSVLDLRSNHWSSLMETRTGSQNRQEPRGRSQCKGYGGMLHLAISMWLAHPAFL